MTITILKWIIILSATINFGFMTFDGARGLIVGDYIRPKTGEYAGQLGPWSKLVKFVGIDPESTLMNLIFVCLGITGLLTTICFSIGYGMSWKAMFIISICSVWYLVPGTMLSILQIVLLIIIHYLIDK